MSVANVTLTLVDFRLGVLAKIVAAPALFRPHFLFGGSADVTVLSVSASFPWQSLEETECCFPSECADEDRLQSLPEPCTRFDS